MHTVDVLCVFKLGPGPAAQIADVEEILLCESVPEAALTPLLPTDLPIQLEVKLRPEQGWAGHRGSGFD